MRPTNGYIHPQSAWFLVGCVCAHNESRARVGRAKKRGSQTRHTHTQQAPTRCCCLFVCLFGYTKAEGDDAE